MTRDEIKDRITMRSVVESYGIMVNRNNMCSCPFHGKDVHPSAKVDTRFHCFVCGEDHDIFSFTQKMDGIDFKTAFLKLGGAYEMITKEQRDKFRERDLERQRKEMARLEWKSRCQVNINLTNKCRDDLAMQKEPYIDDSGEPVMTKEWCYYKQKLNSLLIVWESLVEEGEREGWTLLD